MNRGFLGNKDQRFHFDCSTCKLGKSKILPFPSYGSRANTCFEIIHSDVWGISLLSRMHNINIL
ncbi:hypothetical protein Scep_007633 [Stephania cephalantha]|uniref:Uncharacterized protein n=1 Tax=Stephania cephalantha TaxID=152367 RepID=A0AAP0KAA6_9MAGN